MKAGGDRRKLFGGGGQLRSHDRSGILSLLRVLIQITEVIGLSSRIDHCNNIRANL